LISFSGTEGEALTTTKNNVDIWKLD